MQQKRRFPVAVFNNAFDRVPKQKYPSYHGLEKALTTFDVVGPDTEKTSLKAWSPTRYKWIECPEMSHQLVKKRGRWVEESRPPEERGYYMNRSRQSIQEVTCIVFDYDDGTPLETARGPWMAYNHSWYSSFSHTPEHPKYRLIIYLERPIPCEFWRRVWRWATEQAGGNPDRACKDVSRIYFTPAVRTKDQPILVGTHETGAFLDVDWYELPDEEGRSTYWIKKEPWERIEHPNERMLRQYVSERLKHDRSAREKAADLLGAKHNGDRVWGIRCPKCGRDSVWYLLDPGPQKGAECNHLNTCGWYGWLDQLMDVNAPSQQGGQNG